SRPDEARSPRARAREAALHGARRTGPRPRRDPGPPARARRALGHRLAAARSRAGLTEGEGLAGRSPSLDERAARASSAGVASEEGRARPAVEAFVPLRERLFRRALARALQGCESVLDVGCGPASPLEKAGYPGIAIGLDLSAHELRQAKRRGFHAGF